MESENFLKNYVNDSQVKITNKSKILNPFTWNYNSIHEIDELLVFNSLIKNEKEFVILDIGAQSGLFSLLAKFNENTVWYAFEPEPENYNCLVENLNINEIKNVFTKKLAISNTTGNYLFNVCKTHRGLNTLGSIMENNTEHEYEKIQVETETLDNLFNEIKVDLIKIDTEGSEYNVLLGAKKIINKYKPKILLEYHEQSLNQFEKSLEDIDNIILELNYSKTWHNHGNILITPNHA